MEEVWKDIKGYEGYYQVSNLGNVKSLGRTFIRKDGMRYSRFPRIMSPVFQKTHPYLTIQLKINKKYKGFLIHRLVAEAFVPNPDKKSEVNHIDGNQKNNKSNNLEWCSRSENQIHAIKNNLYSPAKGEQNSSARFTKEQVLSIRVRLKKGEKGADIAREYKVHRNSIYDIKSRKTWKHV